MGRGVSSGGGRSSLGYLFGSGEKTNNAKATPHDQGQTVEGEPSLKMTNGSQSIDKQTPAGIHGSPVNNYHRAEGQNCGNFITERPSTKVHAAPGGGSSLGYLFGGAGN